MARLYSNENFPRPSAEELARIEEEQTGEIEDDLMVMMLVRGHQQIDLPARSFPHAASDKARLRASSSG